MIHYPCQDCDCGRGQGRNCKLRQPRDLTKWEKRFICVLVVCWAVALVKVA